jgi:hypothetical protein
MGKSLSAAAYTLTHRVGWFRVTFRLRLKAKHSRIRVQDGERGSRWLEATALTVRGRQTSLQPGGENDGHARHSTDTFAGSGRSGEFPE